VPPEMEVVPCIPRLSRKAGPESKSTLLPCTASRAPYHHRRLPRKAGLAVCRNKDRNVRGWVYLYVELECDAVGNVSLLKTKRLEALVPTILPRRRNLWVTDTLQWRPEARLAQPANPMRDSAASAFCCS
jgi:hypothetical protein